MKKILNNLKDLLLMLLKKALVVVNNLVKKKLIINFLVAILFLFLGLVIGYKNYDFFKQKVITYSVSFLYDSKIEIKTRFYKDDGKLAYKVAITHEDNSVKHCSSSLINLAESKIRNKFQNTNFNFTARDKDGFKIDKFSYNLAYNGWTRSVCDKKEIKGLQFISHFRFEGNHNVTDKIYRHYDNITVTHN